MDPAGVYSTFLHARSLSGYPAQRKSVHGLITKMSGMRLKVTVAPQMHVPDVLLPKETYSCLCLSLGMAPLKHNSPPPGRVRGLKAL
jgi:hypothetical protein